MPRGVYDRSKLKKNHKGAEKKADSTETVVHAAPKGKPGRKPGSKNKAKAAVSHTAEVKGALVAGLAKADGVGQVRDYNNIFLISEVRSNLATLAVLADKFGNAIPSIQTEIATQVGYLNRLSTETFGVAEAAPAVETKDEEETEQQAAPSNGVSTQQYPTTVPMPPSPVTVPSIPSH